MSTTTPGPHGYPPFQYGPHATGANVYPMSKANAAPALIIWLFLVTNPDFIADIVNGKAPGATPAVGSGDQPMTMADIVQATNLDEVSIRQILAVYDPTDDETVAAFGKVTALFQALSVPFGYPRGACPGPYTITQLALNGASVNPAS